MIDTPNILCRPQPSTRYLFLFAFALACLFAARVDGETPHSGTFTDPRDGNEYRWVRIGTQVWTAENLRYIPASGSKCWADDEAECRNRGVFYDWATALEAAPPGWHLPSDAEWKILERKLGLAEEDLDLVGLDRVNNVASTMKKPGAWPVEYDGQPIEFSNETGFSAVPTGIFALGVFSHEGHAGWWTATPDGEKAWIRALSFHNNMITRAPNNQEFYFPARYVRDTGQTEQQDTH
jgi:uncharacterized protein (TIGR02145 family)